MTNDNMLILPSFAIWPAYFTLKSQEYIYLHIYFFPDTHGMHVNDNENSKFLHPFLLNKSPLSPFSFFYLKILNLGRDIVRNL